jgi:multidrug resistance efflux pump
LKQSLKDVENAQSSEEKGAKREHHAQSVCASPVARVPLLTSSPTRRPPRSWPRLNMLSRRHSTVSTVISDCQVELSAAQAKEQHSAKEYEAAVNEHQRLHQATEQAKAASEKARQNVSSISPVKIQVLIFSTT